MQVYCLPYVLHTLSISQVLLLSPEYNLVGVQIINIAFQSFPLPCYLAHLRPKTFLSTLLLEQSQCCSSLSVKRPSLATIKITRKITILCIFIFILLESKLGDKRSASDDRKHPRLQFALNFYMKEILICKGCFQTYELFGNNYCQF
jgi:hypothetical protein